MMTRFFKHRAPAQGARQCGKAGKARLFRRLLPIFLILSFVPAAAAYESLPVRNGDGNVVFRLDLFGRGDAYWYDSDEGSFIGARDLAETEVGALRRGLEYWTDVLKPAGAPFTPVIVRAGVMPDQDYNAAALFFSSTDVCSEPGCDPGDTYGRVYEALHRGKDLSPEPSGVPDDPLAGAHILTYYHDYSWDTQPDSQLPETEGTLAPTVIHEIGHALGIVYNNPLFSRYLEGTEYDSETKKLGTLVFQGPEATKVFGENIPMAHSSDQEASHFGLRNGLMTHVQITNYPMLMEAELAAVQDIGYTVDRRGFFGLSIYTDATGSGTADSEVSDYGDFYANQNDLPAAIENHLGFFHSRGLDADGNWLGYDTSRPNTTPFGVGLHLYGSGWTVTQKADLLAYGSGGAGVRIDGFDNTVNIPEGVNVAADGERGTGILVSFGSGHTVNSQGTLRATGPLGIAARFDMGAPYVDTPLQSYGTYFDADGDEQLIDGPLVAAFNVSGPLLGGASDPNGQWLSGEFVNYGGREIAVYIGPHAHVDSINILNGATLRGDIISRWDPEKHDLPPLNDGMTSLTFGLEKNTDGSAVAAPDNAFDLDYRGNITGAASLKVSLEGGTLRYAGAVDAHSFEMKSSTTLLADFVGGNPTRISAETITLQTGSTIGFNPAAFAYGKRLEVGLNPLLTFSSETLDYNATLQQSAGAFAVGPYDYTYNGLFDGEDGVRVATTSRAFNHSRGGTDAASAPLAMTARNLGLDSVNDRMVRLFSNPDTARRGAAGNASALLGALRLTDFHRSGASFNDGIRNRFARIAHASPVYAGAADAFGIAPSERNKLYSDEPRSDAERRPLGNGGRETGTGRAGLWMAPSYSLTRHRGSRNFDVHGSGFAAGIDSRMTDSWTLGAAVALDFPRYDSDDAMVNARSVTGFLYSGIRLPLELELALSASFGESHFKQKRDVAGEHYSSSFDSRTTGLGVMLGRRFQVLDNLVLRPFAAADHSYVERPSHNEGGGIYALRYDSARNSIHHLRAGADVAFVFDGGFLSARAYWYGLRGDTREHGRTYFTQDPDRNGFLAPVDGLDRNSLGLAASFGYRLGQSAVLTLEYSRLGGRESTSHQGMIGLRMRF